MGGKLFLDSSLDSILESGNRSKPKVTHMYLLRRGGSLFIFIDFCCKSHSHPTPLPPKKKVPYHEKQFYSSFTPLSKRRVVGQNPSLLKILAKSEFSNWRWEIGMEQRMSFFKRPLIFWSRLLIIINHFLIQQMKTVMSYLRVTLREGTKSLLPIFQSFHWVVIAIVKRENKIFNAMLIIK